MGGLASHETPPPCHMSVCNGVRIQAGNVCDRRHSGQCTCMCWEEACVHVLCVSMKCMCMLCGWFNHGIIQVPGSSLRKGGGMHGGKMDEGWCRFIFSSHYLTGILHMSGGKGVSVCLACMKPFCSFMELAPVPSADGFSVLVSFQISLGFSDG